MKTAFLIIASVAILVFSGSSFAAIHGTVDDREDLRPDSASDLNSISSELAEIVPTCAIALLSAHGLEIVRVRILLQLFSRHNHPRAYFNETANGSAGIRI